MRLPRVRLRTLMIAVAVVALSLGGLVWVVRQLRIAEAALGKEGLLPRRAADLIPQPPIDGHRPDLVGPRSPEPE